MPAGELFQSFDESWQSFLGRREPLESIIEEIPADAPDGTRAVVWLLRPDAGTVARAVAAQQSLPEFHWLRRLPPGFLHVSVGQVAREGDVDVATELERGRAAVADRAPFELEVPRLTCFHTAVVAELEPRDRVADIHARLFPARTFETLLPHLTLAVLTERAPVEPLRDVLVPLRDTHLGHFSVDEVALCLVPWTRATFLAHWEVAGVAPLMATPQNPKAQPPPPA